MTDFSMVDSCVADGMTIEALRKEFPDHHDTKFRLLVRKKYSHEVLCDELFESYEDVDRRTSSLFCYRDGKPPKYDSRHYTIDIFHPLSEYECEKA